MIIRCKDNSFFLKPQKEIHILHREIPIYDIRRKSFYEKNGYELRQLEKKAYLCRQVYHYQKMK